MTIEHYMRWSAAIERAMFRPLFCGLRARRTKIVN